MSGVGWGRRGGRGHGLDSRGEVMVRGSRVGPELPRLEKGVDGETAVSTGVLSVLGRRVVEAGEKGRAQSYSTRI